MAIALQHESATRPLVGAERIASAELFARWQDHGDPRAREELVTRFLPLARKLARRYSGAHEPLGSRTRALFPAAMSRSAS